MANYIKIGADWKTIVNYFVHAGGSFKGLINGWINIAGVWKSFFEATLAPQSTVTISQATNGTTYLTTLTGTNYYWSPGPPSLTYRFQWWNGVSWSDISTGSAINPAYGSSTSYTQLLQSTGPSIYVQPNQVNRFRFKVDGTYGAQSASSISSETTIQGPTSVTLTAGTAASTSVDLSWTASTGASRYMVYYSTNNSVFTLFGGTSAISATVTGLVPGTLYYFKVIPITGSSNDTGYYGSYSNTVSQTTSAGSALTPTFGANTSTANGFTGSVTNYDSAYNWNTPSNNSFTLTNGTWAWGTPSGATRTFTVTGLSASQSSTATVTTTRPGYTSGSNTTTGTASALPQYTVTWSANLSGATVSPASNTVNSGTTVTSPTPTRSGYTFLYWRDGTTVFNYANQINPGGSWTVTYTTTFYAWWSLNPVIPSGGTVSISTNTGNYNVGSVITYSTSGWADTPTSYSLRLYNGTNPVLTSDPLRASTSSASGTYTIVSGDVPNYFKAFATASNSAGTSTEASSTQVGPAVATFVAPTCVAPSLQFLRTSGSSRLDWYCDYPTPSGNYSSITGMDFEIRTTAGGGTLLASGTRAYPGSGTYPYSAAGTIWAFRMGTANGDISYSSSARYGRARVIMLGSNGSTYYGTWSGWI